MGRTAQIEPDKDRGVRLFNVPAGTRSCRSSAKTRQLRTSKLLIKPTAVAQTGVVSRRRRFRRARLLGAWSNGLYSASPEQRDAYLYSPAFAQLADRLGWPLRVFWLGCSR